MRSKHYRGTFLRNIATNITSFFKTPMKDKLDNNRISSIEEVQRYADANPGSHTAKVYSSLIKEKEVVKEYSVKF